MAAVLVSYDLFDLSHQMGGADLGDDFECLPWTTAPLDVGQFTSLDLLAGAVDVFTMLVTTLSATYPPRYLAGGWLPRGLQCFANDNMLDMSCMQ